MKKSIVIAGILVAAISVALAQVYLSPFMSPQPGTNNMMMSGGHMNWNGGSMMGGWGNGGSMMNGGHGGSMMGGYGYHGYGNGGSMMGGYGYGGMHGGYGNGGSMHGWHR
jgi:hypothetical protein